MSDSYNPYTKEPQKKLYDEAVTILKSRTKPIPIKDFLQKLREKVPDAKPDYLYYRVILESSKDPESPINSTGRGKGGGYFYEEPEVTEQDQSITSVIDLEGDDKSEKRKYDQVEKRLWQPVARWLLANKRPTQVSADVAMKKKGGVWGNPDVVGLAPIKRLGFFDIEITSVEVKPSLSRWEYFFFEAVSHKRFAERSYFAFYEENFHKYKIDDLVSYAEKYGVGLLRLDLTLEQFSNLDGWASMEGGVRDELIGQFFELYPAPYSPVELRVKCDFLENIGIRYDEDIYGFGVDEDI